MELTWTTLVFLCLGAAIVWFWQNSLAAREAANAAALEACGRLGLQFLDGTVAFAHIALQRVGGGNVLFKRTYVFDYTADSISRRQGFVILVGRGVESVGFAQEQQVAGHDVSPPVIRSTSFEPPPLPPAPPRPPSDSNVPDSNAPDSNVLDLERWRRHRRR
jgi:hypothetical protein